MKTTAAIHVAQSARRRLNKFNARLSREKDLVRRDMRRGHSTRRVTRALRRTGEGRTNIITVRR